VLGGLEGEDDDVLALNLETLAQSRGCFSNVGPCDDEDGLAAELETPAKGEGIPYRLLLTKPDPPAWLSLRINGAGCLV